MQYSDNYGLKLPQRGVDRANVDDLDDNFEIIDGALADDRQISLLMYDSSATYNTDDIVGYENPSTHRIRAYKCLADNVTGQWDSTKWAQTTLAAEIGQGGGGSSTFAGLSDVDFDNLQNGQVPKYNSTSGKWENANPTGGVSELSDLDDVSVTTPSDGDILEYDDGDWVNKTPTPVSREVEGNPISFSDGSDSPLVSCSVEIEAQQDLHGYDKPWVGGAGKNKLPQIVTDIISDNSAGGTWSGNTYTSNNGVTVELIERGGCCVGYKVNGTTTGQVDFKIKNYFNSTDAFIESGTYSATMAQQSTNATLLVGYGPTVLLNNTTVRTATCTDGIAWALLRLSSGETFNNVIFEIQIESGSTPSVVEPYSNICPISGYSEMDIDVADASTSPTVQEEYSINLGSTRYGGTLDVISGVLRVIHGYKDLSEISGWRSYPVAYGLPKRFAVAYQDMKSDDSIRLCSMVETKAKSDITTTSDNCIFASDGYINIALSIASNVSDFEQIIIGQTICYELATPIEVQLTPTEIRSLLGNNYISTDGKKISIEYITSKYSPIMEVTERETKTIDEMLTENIESSMVASQNYTTGELIIACGKIYRATANIASGSNLTVGTNVVKTTIEAEIARSGGGVNYSTTEHVVGTWIDGSTVYEKTFSFSIPSNNYTTETTGITNFDKCVGYSGIVALGNGYFEDINYGRPDSSNSTYYIAITTTGDIFFKTYEASSGTAYITMRYTKSSS